MAVMKLVQTCELSGRLLSLDSYGCVWQYLKVENKTSTHIHTSWRWIRIGGPQHEGKDVKLMSISGFDGKLLALDVYGYLWQFLKAETRTQTHVHTNWKWVRVPNPETEEK